MSQKPQQPGESFGEYLVRLVFGKRPKPPQELSFGPSHEPAEMAEYHMPAESAKLPPHPDDEFAERIARAVDRVFAPGKAKADRSNMGFSMSLEDAVYWIALTVFGTGLYLVSEHMVWGLVLLGIGVGGLIYSMRNHMPVTSYRTWILVVTMLITLGTVGYDIYDRHFGGGSIPAVSRSAPDPRDPQVCFDDKPCPSPEESAKRRAFLDDLRAVGTYAPDNTRHIRFVADGFGAPFARTLINLCLSAQWDVWKDKASDTYLAAPFGHQIADGITVRAPADSAAAETLSVALATAFGIKSKRLGPLPYMGDYVVVEIGRLGN